MKALLVILALGSLPALASEPLPLIRIKCQGPGLTVLQCRAIRFKGSSIKAVCDGAITWVNENACLYIDIPTPEQSAILHRGGTSATY